MKRKILALLLACMMVISMVPGTVFAADISIEEMPDAKTCTCETPKLEAEAFQTMAPTCVSWGYKAYYCKNKDCGGVKIELNGEPTGVHKDLADETTGLADHKCDVCGEEKFSTCKDEDTNHACDVCGAAMGTHEAAEGQHTCAYCGKAADNGCVDDNTDHKCDVCTTAMGTHVAAEGKHTCDYCGKAADKGCVDDGKDHKCDVCGEDVGEHKPAEGKHTCDYCGKAADNGCVDADKNHECDVCKTPMGTHVAAEGKHTCDYCGKVADECKDSDTDHKCDVCGTAMGTHKAAEGKHTCDYCGKAVDDCVDEGKDHVCDVCGAAMGGACADVSTDDDHKCDYCGKVLSTCDEHPVTEKGAPATCYKEGYSYYVVCGECGKTLVAPQVLPIDPNAHSYDLMKPKASHEATCTEGAYVEYECLNGCGVPLPVNGKGALGHDMAAATCTAPATCKRCGVTDGEKLGHDENGPAATCTTDKVCARENCDYVLVGKLGHDESGSAATCTTDKVCARENCGEVLKGKLGHDWKDVAEKAPSIFEPGHSAGKECQREGCGAFEGSAFEAQLAEKVTFNYEVTAVNVTSGTITIKVYMATENGVRIEALQWSMFFDSDQLELVDDKTSFKLAGLTSEITKSATADKNDLVVISAYAADGLETYAATKEGEKGYEFATLTFKIKEGAEAIYINKYDVNCEFSRPDAFVKQNGYIQVTDNFEGVEKEVILLGDYTGSNGKSDGIVDVFDLAALLRELNALDPNNENDVVDYDKFFMFDMDLDGDIDLVDLTKLQQLIVTQGPRWQ